MIADLDQWVRGMVALANRYPAAAVVIGVASVVALNFALAFAATLLRDFSAWLFGTRKRDYTIRRGRNVK